ncbi:MAG: NAD(P)/FAD-dependent oxidoreductase [Actinomycetales bacterium]
MLYRSDPYDVLVIGAGPAGLAAAGAALAAGARTGILDAAARPGGQYWRHPLTPAADARTARYHHELPRYRTLVAAVAPLRASGDYLAGHEAWLVVPDDDGFAVHLRAGGSGSRAGQPVDRGERSVRLRARRLVIATGAYDRQIPFPGWDLPGVMTAGAAQALLKGHDVVVPGRVVVAGTGPFLLPVAAGLLAGGGDVAAVVEAARARAWSRHVGAVAGTAGKLGEALGYAAQLARHRVPVLTGAMVTRAEGEDRLEAVVVERRGPDGRPRPATARRIPADILAVGWGFTPRLELAVAVGCRTGTDADGSVVGIVDDSQASSVEGVYLAGEVCGVGGAELAVTEGRIAGAAASGDRTPPLRLRRRRSRLRAFAAAMHAAHPVPQAWIDRVEPDTTICRCEEVTAAALRDAVDRLGADNARAAKLMVRTGMGWCQGRVCGYPTSCLVARWTGQPVRDTLVERPVAAPITFGALADSVDDDAGGDLPGGPVG